MKHLLSFLLLISFGAQAGTKHLVVMGGGGEPKKDTTIFDSDLKALGLFAKNNPDYNTKISFNGGHSVTEGIAREHFSSFDQSNHFTEKNFEDTIKSYEDQITSGKIGQDDQLLIHINTHGSTKDNGTHNISTAQGPITNYNSLGSDVVSMDRLKNLANLAEKKGVKLAIIDLSCHSGNSLSLANSKTCVISSTGPNHYAYNGNSTTFPGRFNKNLGKGKSLEQVFLETRNGYNDMSFPMISSPQGKDVQDRLYERLSPYLYSFDPKHNKLSPYMEEKVSKGEKCDFDEQYDSLINETEGLLKVVDDDKTKAIVNEFKQTVAAYYAYLDEIKKKMQYVGFSEMKNKHPFCTNIPADKKKKIKARTECIEYTTENLMTLEFDNILGYFKESLSLKESPDQKASALATMENIMNAKIMRDQILKDHPEYAEAKNFWSTLPDLQMKTERLGEDVSRAQQKVYDHLYRQSKVTGPNPCSDFVL